MENLVTNRRATKLTPSGKGSWTFRLQIRSNSGRPIQRRFTFEAATFDEALERQQELVSQISDGLPIHLEVTAKVPQLRNRWYRMIQRCYRVSEEAYANYGGRGISVCDEWKSDYRRFEAWALANGYSEDLTLERVDVNGNYEPANCRWATVQEQMCNKRNSHRVTIDGETKTITEWSRDPRCVVALATIYKRLAGGWSYEEAIFNLYRQPACGC